METGFIQWIDALKQIPEFKTDVEALQEKYKTYPLMPGGMRHHDATHYKQQNDFVEAFYREVLSLDEKIRAWLKKEYPDETNNKTLFWADGSYPYGGTPIENYGLDKWIQKTCKPADHGGYPGAQWAFDCSIQGKLTKLCPALQQAYWKCKAGREEKEKEKARQEEESNQRLEKYQKQKEVTWQKNWTLYQKKKQAYIQEDVRTLLRTALGGITREYEILYNKLGYNKIYVFHEERLGKEKAKKWMNEIQQAAKDLILQMRDIWIPRLEDSIGMHWFPERVDKGVRRPGEWKPDFNLDVAAKMERECGLLLANRIREDAWKKGEQKRDLVSIFHKN
jgi:hypothetical protein